jgi:D-alanine-D-alanine ligase
MKKKKILVLMGGKSSEHDISILSGKEIVRNLDKKKYTVDSFILPKNFKTLNKDFNKYDLIFNALHGQFGEDGTIQAILETAGVKYTGSDMLASALGMNKAVFHQLLKANNIPYPKGIVVQRDISYKEVRKNIGNLPYFVKPVSGGSSVGAMIVKTEKTFPKALIQALKFEKQVLVEKYIKGKEFTVSVLGNDSPYSLPVVEIVPKAENFFGYKSKYTKGGTDEIVPARIIKTLEEKLQKLAVDCHKLIGCRGYSRTDFIVDEKGKPYILEINTLPGLTAYSLLPKAAKAEGISYSQLLDKIIMYAFK